MLSILKIKDFIIKNKKILYIIFFISFLFLSQEISFAIEQQESNEKSVNSIMWLFQIISAWLGILTQLVAVFLHPNWINGKIFWLEAYLKDIWLMISNVVYLIFAVLLIIISFMNIIWKWENKWELKQALPKFFIWVMMVPLSWFIIQAILTISSLLSFEILTIPYKTLNKTQNETLSQICICKDYDVNLSKKSDSSWNIDEFIKCRDPKIYDKSEEKCASPNYTSLYKILRWEGDSLYSIISIYTYSIINIESIDTLKKEDFSWESAISDIFSLFLKLGFDSIFIIIYLLLLVTLFLALFIRWIWIWIYTMMSPVFGLFYFFDIKGDEWYKRLNISSFISLAMVPVYVSAALSIWLLFLFIATDNSIKNWNKAESNIPWVFSINSAGSIIFWWFDFKLSWNINGSSSSYISKVYKEWNSAIWQLFMQIFWLAILWIAIMAALESSNITKSIIEPISRFWNTMWSLLAKAPSYIPMIPTYDPKTKKMTTMTIHWTDSFANSINQWLTNTSSERWSNFWSFLTWTNTSPLIQTLNTMKNGSISVTDTTFRSNFKSLIWNLKNPTQTDLNEVNSFLKNKNIIKDDFSLAELSWTNISNIAQKIRDNLKDPYKNISWITNNVTEIETILNSTP